MMEYYYDAFDYALRKLIESGMKEEEAEELLFDVIDEEIEFLKVREKVKEFFKKIKGL